MQTSFNKLCHYYLSSEKNNLVLAFLADTFLGMLCIPVSGVFRGMYVQNLYYRMLFLLEQTINILNIGERTYY